jgi:alpha-amylase
MNLESLTNYLSKMDHKFNLFDAPLVENFHRISTSDGADMRSVFDNTLVKAEPYNAVTLVMNHDTQPGQALQLDVADWFVPLAYALILLRQDGCTYSPFPPMSPQNTHHQRISRLTHDPTNTDPCLFWGDLYGLQGGVPNDSNTRGPTAQGKIPDLALARKLFAYGEQNDYFDHEHVVGWVRRGTWDHPDGLAVLMSNAEAGEKRMFVGELHAGEVWTDLLGWSAREVRIGDDGFGVFECGSCSVSVFGRREAKGRERFGGFDASIY